MAHHIEDLDIVLSVQSPEWHGLAKVKDKIGEEEIAPLLFDIVEGKPSVTCPDGSVITVEGYKMLLADIRHRNDLTLDQIGKGYVPLHVPRDSYQVISNREVWSMIMEAFRDTGATVTSAGTLNNLKTFMVSVDIGNPEFRANNGDVFQNYMSFITSHNGVYALSAYDTSIRMICHNTLVQSIEQAGDFGVKMYHTKNASSQMSYLPEYLKAVIDNRRALQANMNTLQDIPVSKGEVESVLSGYLSKGGDVLSTLSYNRVESIAHLASNGMGNHGNTRYDLLNGFTEYFTHGEGAGGKKGDKMKRFCASRFGAASDHKKEFFNLLVQDESLYQEAKAIGERLHYDKKLALASA